MALFAIADPNVYFPYILFESMLELIMNTLWLCQLQRPPPIEKFDMRVFPVMFELNNTSIPE